LSVALLETTGEEPEVGLVGGVDSLAFSLSREIFQPGTYKGMHTGA